MARHSTARVEHDHLVHAEDGERLFRIPNRPFQPGDQLPAVCTIAVVAWVLGVSASHAHRMHRQRFLDKFQLGSLGDQRARYSGKLLKQWAEGASNVAVMGEPRRGFFGRKTFGHE